MLSLEKHCYSVFFFHIDYTDLCDFDGSCDWTLKNVENMTEKSAAEIVCYLCRPEPAENVYPKPTGECGKYHYDELRT